MSAGARKINVKPPPSANESLSAFSVVGDLYLDPAKMEADADADADSGPSLSKRHASSRVRSAFSSSRLFLENTTIHGMLYLTRAYGGTWPQRLIWAGIVVGSFAWAIFAINDSFEEWRLHPVETVIGSPVYHVTNVQYPTVSICEGQNIQGRIWGPTARYLNTAEFPCASNVASDCKPNRAWSNTFFPLFRRIFRFKFANEWEREEKRNIIPCNGCARNQANSILWSLGDSLVSAESNGSNSSILTDIQELVVANLHINITAQDFIETVLLPYLRTQQGQQGACSLGKVRLCSVTLHPLLLSVDHLLDARRFRLGLGTFLAGFSSLFNPADDSAIEDDMMPLNNMLVRALSCVANVTDTKGGNIGLLDVMLLTAAPDPSDYRMRTAIETLVNSSVGLVNNAHCNSSGLRELARAWRWSRQGTVRQKINNPCSPEKTNKPGCCGYWNTFLAQYWDLIMKLKRDYRFIGSTGPTPDPDLDDTMNRCLAKEGIRTNELGTPTIDPAEFRMAPICIYNEESCADFEPMMSIHGIAFSLNARSVRELFIQNEYVSKFEDTFGANHTVRVTRNRGSGQSYATLLVLDAHNDADSDMTQMFALSIGSKNTPFEVNEDEYQVSAGYRTTLRVSMTQVASRPEIRSLSPASRDCRFTDERILGMNTTFQEYSKTGCQMACSLKMAVVECGCIPWDYPRTKDVPLCGLFGSTCFRQQMSNVTRMRDCSCPDDCDVTAFSFTETREALAPDTYCMDGTDPLFQYLERRAGSTSLYSDRVLGRTNWLSVWSDDVAAETEPTNPKNRNSSACLELLKRNIAVIEIELPSATMLRTENRLRMTLTEQIGVLGGTLGLFTGMSIISICEFLFYIKDLIWRVFRSH